MHSSTPPNLVKFLLVSFCLLMGFLANSQTNTPRTVSIDNNCGGYLEYLPAGYSANPTKKYPTLIYIHGGASFGNGTAAGLALLTEYEGVPYYINQGTFPSSIVTPYGDTASFIAISPQFMQPPTTPQDIKAVIAYVLAHYQVDLNRLYLTGYSLGGGAVWQAPYNVAAAKQLAAMVPVAGYDNPFVDTTALFIAEADLPVWAIHSTADQTAPDTWSINFVNQINSYNPPIPALLTLLTNGLSHDSTVLAVYNPTFRPNGKNIYEWMLNYARAYPPIAKVGKDTTIVLPVNSVTLSGSQSTDPQGSALSYLWTQVSGPAQYSFSSTTAVSPVVSGMLAGKYIFKLTVTDAAGLSGSATDTIFVINPNASIPPVANGGNYTTVLFPQTSITLNASGSYAPNGAIETYSWSELSGPTKAVIASPATVTTSINNLRRGTYKFGLTVTDNLDSVGRDTIQVLVIDPLPNIPPVARAGADQTISLPVDSVVLNGSASSDTDGIIVSYHWRQLSGPSQSSLSNANAVTTTAGNLVAGIYQFELAVQDDSSAIARDTVAINVNPLAKLIQVNVYGGTNPAGTGWNNWNVSSSLSSSAFTYSTGATSTVKAVLSVNTAVADNGTSYPTTMCPPAVGRYASYDYTPRTLVLSGLDSTKTYNLQFYATRAGGQPNTYAIGSTSVNIVVNDNYSTPVNFTNPIPSGGKITVNISGSYNYINGFTITEFGNAASADTNKLPVAKAGANQSINLPVTQVKVNGSGSYDLSGTITSYSWQQLSGPAPATIVNPNVDSTLITGLDSGTYVFQLTVTDNFGAVGTSTTTITVGTVGYDHIPPVANAGPDVSINLPVDSVRLNGSSSSDTDGTITTYSWSKISGPSQYTISNASVVNPTISNLYKGTYLFSLTVTDNFGAIGIDTVVLFVTATPPIPPVAAAGPDTTLTPPINFTTLNGSGSYDRDTTIVGYSWNEVSGPGAYTINNSTLVNPQISNLIAGTYIIELDVTDANGLVGKDTVTVTVKAHLPPVSVAGNNASLTLPVNTLQLNGGGSSDPDGTIVSYLWSEVSGPAPLTISDSALVNPTISNLIAGVYVVNLTVTDNLGATGTSTVTITVNSAPHVPPVANAGPDQTIILPTNSTVLNGSASTDPDGYIIAYAWRQLTGPSTSVLSQPDSVSTTVSGLVAGTYSFELAVTDDSLATSRDTVLVTAKVHLPPIAVAGGNVKLVLPVNTVQLNGSGSSDPDGTIVSYLWAEVSGPASLTISDSALVNPVVSNLIAGVYVISLTVTDNFGATGVSTDTITVTAAPHIPPVANAGPDQTIILPANSAVLNGSASTDPDGYIIAYAWRQLTGPSTSVLSQPDSVSTTVSDLVAGAYSFELAVTDDSLATSRDTVSVTVSTGTRLIQVNVYGGSNPAGTGWNNWNVSSSLSSGLLFYSDNSSSTVSAVLSANTGVADNGANYPVTMCPVAVGRTASYNWTQRTLIISGLSASKIYNFQAYDTRTNGQLNTYTINGTSVIINPNGNYANAVNFNNITPTNGAITVTLFGSYNYINGFTLTENPATTGTTTGTSTMTASANTFSNTSDSTVLVAYPNPFQGQVQLQVNNGSEGQMRVNIIDQTGRTIREYEFMKVAGAQTETLSLQDLPVGIYYIQVQMATWQKTIKVWRNR